MSFYNRVSNAISRGLINAGRTRARQDLLHRDERILADSGFSRYLLEQGNTAWPWRADGAGASADKKPATLPTGPSSPEFAEPVSLEKSYTAAERELRTYSDAELSDLGIVRCNISEAVRMGRPGIDWPVDVAIDRQAA